MNTTARPGLRQEPMCRVLEVAAERLAGQPGLTAAGAPLGCTSGPGRG